MQLVLAARYERGLAYQAIGEDKKARAEFAAVLAGLTQRELAARESDEGNNQSDRVGMIRPRAETLKKIMDACDIEP